MERLALCQCARSPDLAFRARSDLVERTPADAACPTGMAHDREADHTDAVETATAFRCFGEREVRVPLGHEDVVDAVVDAASPAQAEDVPVVDERGFFNRQHEDPRFAGALDDAERVDVRAVLDAGREAPRA